MNQYEQMVEMLKSARISYYIESHDTNFEIWIDEQKENRDVVFCFAFDKSTGKLLHTNAINFQ